MVRVALACVQSLAVLGVWVWCDDLRVVLGVTGLSAAGILAGLLLTLWDQMNAQLERIRGSRRVPRQHDIVMYQVGQEDLRSLKALQWNVTYYAALLFGAIFGLASYCRGQAAWAGRALILAALAVAVYGVYAVVDLQYRMRNTRVGMAHTRCYELHVRPEDPDRKKIARFWRDARILGAFIATVIAGLLVDLVRLYFVLDP